GASPLSLRRAFPPCQYRKRCVVLQGPDYGCVIGGGPGARSRWSADRAAAALPARAGEEGSGAGQEPGRLAADGVPAGGPGAVGIGARERPVDQKPPADDVIARDEAPLTAVRAVVAVVPHDEVLSPGDRQRPEIVEPDRVRPGVPVV